MVRTHSFNFAVVASCLLTMLLCCIIVIIGRKDDLIKRLREYTSGESGSDGMLPDKTADQEEEDDMDKENENNAAFNILTLEIQDMQKKKSTNPTTKRKLLGNNTNFAPLVVEEMLDYTLE